MLCAAVLLAGCSGMTPFASAPATSVPVRSPADGSKREVLAASKTHFRCAHYGETMATTFDATGKASGSRRGTFTASGIWSLSRYNGSPTWSFREDFTIVSGSHYTSGVVLGGGTSPPPMSCFKFGPAALKYRVTKVRGDANVQIKNRKLQETLDGF